MIWHSKLSHYWEFIATKDKHGMTFTLFDLADFDESLFRELCEDLIKYINHTSCQKASEN